MNRDRSQSDRRLWGWQRSFITVSMFSSLATSCMHVENVDSTRRITGKMRLVEAKDTAHFVIEGTVARGGLSLHTDHADWCTEQTPIRDEKIRTTTRSPDGQGPTTVLGVSAAAVAGGGTLALFTYLKERQCADQATCGGPVPAAEVFTTSYTASVVLVVAGLAGGIIAGVAAGVGESLAGSDVRVLSFDDSVITGKSQICGSRTPASVEVVLTDPETSASLTRTSSDGALEVTAEEFEAVFRGRRDRVRDETPTKLTISVAGQRVGDIDAGPIFDAWRVARAEKDATASREALAWTIDNEVKTGRCDPNRYANIQGALGEASSYLKRMRSPNFHEMAHGATVATPEGTAMEVQTGMGGLIHVFAVGFDPLTLNVMDGTGYLSTKGSTWEGLVGTLAGGQGGPGGLDSRIVNANPGEKLVVTVKGKGCVGLVAFREW